jgi:hypothetical protein
MDVVDDDDDDDANINRKLFFVGFCFSFRLAMNLRLEIVSEGRQMFVCRFRLLAMGVSCSKKELRVSSVP